MSNHQDDDRDNELEQEDNGYDDRNDTSACVGHEFDPPPPRFDALPIFPLPDSVILPGGLMPLHVFEPRYRDLTRDCLAGDHLLAIARLQPGNPSDHSGRPMVYDQAGVGRIIASDELPDGRFMLVLRGIGRVQFEHELDATRSYRQMRARTILDLPIKDREVAKARHAKLITLCDQLAMELGRTGSPGAKHLHELVRGAGQPGKGQPGACADAIASALIMDANARQALLEERCPNARLAYTIEQVGAILCALADCDGSLN